ncbi:MAG: hypothetical protein U0792_22045 [Gemmataceae bacterium]
MSRLIGLVVLIGLVGGGVYLWMFKKNDTIRTAKGLRQGRDPGHGSGLLQEGNQ